MHTFFTQMILFCGDYLADCSSKEGSMENKSVFRSFWSFWKKQTKKEICTLPPINTLVQIGSLPWGTKSKYQGPQVPNRIIKVSKFIILISSSLIQTLMFCVKQTMGEMLTKLHFFIYVLCVNWKMAYM